MRKTLTFSDLYIRIMETFRSNRTTEISYGNEFVAARIKLDPSFFISYNLIWLKTDDFRVGARILLLYCTEICIEIAPLHPFQLTPPLYLKNKILTSMEEQYVMRGTPCAHGVQMSIPKCRRMYSNIHNTVTNKDWNRGHRDRFRDHERALSGGGVIRALLSVRCSSP